MGLETYIQLRAKHASSRSQVTEAETQRSKDATESDREWLLAALLAIAIRADDAIASGASTEAATAKLRSEWMSALKKAGTSAFNKGVMVRSSETPTQLAKIADESERLREQFEEQSRFISNFADEYIGGATLEPRRMSFINRANLYALSMVGYYNLGAISGGSPNDKIYWRLGACDHCTDCPALHVSGPYTPQTLPTVPGLGHTRCGHWCCCHLYIVPDLLGPVLALSLDSESAMSNVSDMGPDVEDGLMDARLIAGFDSREAIESSQEDLEARAAESEAALADMISDLGVDFDDTFPIGGPIVGMSQSGIIVPDLMYDRGIDADSLRSVSPSDIETFLEEQFDRGVE